MTSRPPRVLAFGTYNAQKHPRIGILISGLRKNGCLVEEINHPMELSTAQRVEILKKPWKLFGFAWMLLRLWRALRRDAHQWVMENGHPDAVLVGYMGHFDVLLAHHVFKGIPIILDHLIFAGDTAKDRGTQGLKVKLLQKLDIMAINAATLTLLDTKEHQAMMPRNHPSMVVPVGASDDWYAAGDNEHIEERALYPRRDNSIVFYGLYTPLQGVPVIAKAIRLLNERGLTAHFTLIGEGQDYDEVRSLTHGLENIEFRTWVETKELPSLVASHAISLGIFSTTPKGLHVVPNKVYQSMAAGCAVITSDTAPQRRMLNNGVIYVQPGNPQELADVIERLINDRMALAHAQRNSRSTAKQFVDYQVTHDLSEWITALIP